MKQNPSLRTKAMAARYAVHMRTLSNPAACALCTESALRTFKHWRIIDNNFPYDIIAKDHHMIVPLRHVTENGLTEEELDELRVIKHEFLHQTYDWIIEASSRIKSIPNHFHLHLIVGKTAPAE